jgi:hypothetical protein
MANVDATFDSNSPQKYHGAFIVTGTIAATTTANETRLGKDIPWCHVEDTTDDETTDIRIGINLEDDFSTASQGLIAHQAEGDDDTYRFTAAVLF